MPVFLSESLTSVYTSNTDDAQVWALGTCTITSSQTKAFVSSNNGLQKALNMDLSNTETFGSSSLVLSVSIDLSHYLNVSPFKVKATSLPICGQLLTVCGVIVACFCAKADWLVA